MRDFKDIPDDSIRAITAPTLVVCGDTDVVRPEHAVELTRLSCTPSSPSFPALIMRS